MGTISVDRVESKPAIQLVLLSEGLNSEDASPYAELTLAAARMLAKSILDAVEITIDPEAYDGHGETFRVQIGAKVVIF